MARARKPSSSHDDTIDSPTAWFAVLDRARRIENYDLAARAKRELDRLGVTVRFRQPPTGSKLVGTSAGGGR